MDRIVVGVINYTVRYSVPRNYRRNDVDDLRNLIRKKGNILNFKMEVGKECMT